MRRWDLRGVRPARRTVSALSFTSYLLATRRYAINSMIDMVTSNLSSELGNGIATQTVVATSCQVTILQSTNLDAQFSDLDSNIRT